MENLTTTGAAGVIIAVVLILRTVFEFLEKMNARKAAKSGEEKGFNQKDRNLLYETHRWMSELHSDREKSQKLYDWHDQQDSDGVPIWYVRSGLENNIEKLSEAIEQLSRSSDANTHLLETLCNEMRSSRRAGTEG